jgi:hypothetical protein
MRQAHTGCRNYIRNYDPETFGANNDVKIRGWAERDREEGDGPGQN